MSPWLLPFSAELLITLLFAGVLFYLRRSLMRSLRELTDEVIRLRKQTAGQLDQDPLTGLLNRSALSRWVDEEHGFDGLVVVCDMDDFKTLNDQHGHLVGDEILRGVGHLVRSSIRNEDLAFRWGGDEFVIFFRTDDVRLVHSRMQGVEEHLRNFYIRHHGVTAIRFSWGIASTTGRPLRDGLADADRMMYEAKRSRRLDPREGRASHA